MRRVARDLEIWLPGTALIVLVLACFVWPLFGRVPDPLDGTLIDALQSPLSPGHVLGTDLVGRDVMARLLYGGRISLEVAAGANLIGLVAGGLIGIISALKGRWIDAVIMRVLDILLAFPALIASVVVANYLGPSELNVIFAISFFSVPAYARLARAATLRLKEQVYITAAKLLGQPDRTIMVRHVAPNVMPQLLTYSLLHVGTVVVLEAALSFLGVGIPAPAPSWGNMIAGGQAYLNTSPQLVLIPSAVLVLTVLCVNLVGDGLRAKWGSR